MKGHAFRLKYEEKKWKRDRLRVLLYCKVSVIFEVANKSDESEDKREITRYLREK